MSFRPSILMLALALAGSIATARAESPALPWVDGTHILAEKNADLIAKITALPAKPARRDVRKRTPIGGSEFFWATNVATNQFYQAKGILRKIGKCCYIYVEEGYQITDATLDKLAQQFDDRVYPTDRAWFGSEDKPGIDFDDRITLFLLDIQDGWEPGKGYVAGYFFPLNEVSTDLFPQSNERQMFYLDTHPGEPSRDDYLGVLAHEFQHMIHFNHDKGETRWLNEALAQIGFFVCGYGHAPQTFQYVRNTDVNMEDFNNSLENYGAAYLWTYYLLTHYGGATLDVQQNFIKSIVASQEKSFASIETVLKANGVTKPVKDIFVDWAVANAAGDPSIDGGRYGYDSTLKFGVNNPAQTYGLESLSSETVKEKVNAWACDYIVYTNDTSYSPHRPSMIDKITVSGVKPGAVVWNVNAGELPPQKLIPEGSAINDAEKFVTTPLAKNADGKYEAKIGHFARLGKAIRTLNFHFKYEDGTTSLPKSVEIFTIDAVTQASKAAPEADRSLVFTFAGEKKKEVALRAVIKKTNGTTKVVEIPTDANNAATWKLDGAGDDLESLTICVIGLHGKKTQEYSYSLKSGREVKREENFQSLGQAGMAGRFAVGAVAPMAPAIAQAAKSDEGDTSHDNIGYFLGKNQEAIHGLTHLQIDPQFIEGTLFKLWRLLEIARGFPHLPLPDGLGFVDFNESTSQALVKGWAKDFGIDLGHVAGGQNLVARADEAAVKATLKRLLYSQKFAQFAYNSSLPLAADFGVTFLQFGKFVLGSRGTLGLIATHFANVPVIGALASKLNKLIIGKLIRAGDNVVWFIAGKLHSPYNMVVPLAYTIITNIVARSMDIPLDPIQGLGQTKDFIVGTFAKYALVSIPKIGYVARGQKAVDVAASFASGLTAHGSFEDAVKKVWDDGDPNTDNSLREKITLEIARRQELTLKEKHIAWITQKLAEAASLVSVIDPTSISRVVSIVLSVGTAGIFAHSGYVSASYFFRLPRNEVLTGVNQMFDPSYVPAEDITSRNGGERLAPASISPQATQRAVANLEDTFAEYLKEAQALAADAKNERSFDHIFALDAQLDDLSDRAQAMVFAAQVGSDTDRETANDAMLDTLYTESQTCLFTRAGLLADLFARRAGSTDLQVNLTSKYAPAFSKYLNAVRAGVATLTGRADLAAPLYVSKTEVERLGNNQYVVTATVVNDSAADIRDITVQMYSGLDYTCAEGDKRTLSSLGSDGEVQVSWKITLNEAKPVALPTVVITTEAPGVKGLSKSANLEY